MGVPWVSHVQWIMGYTRQVMCYWIQVTIHNHISYDVVSYNPNPIFAAGVLLHYMFSLPKTNILY